MSKGEEAMEKFSNFSEWYDKVLLEAEIVDDRYPVKGFSVYRGWGYSIVKRIYEMLEEKLEETGHQPMQFPVVIPEDAFQKEEDHIEGFSAEVFWITHAGDNELERKLLLRPTSETAIYPMFNLWIRSHADLPLLMHQTCNVYRYETKATRPLFRGREFLWNEAHTAHTSYENAERQVLEGITIYSQVYDALGLSYLKLKRPDFDKFAGADYSVAFDTWNPDGKVNQVGTVHHLGDNFSRAFELTFENEEGEQKNAFTTCYGMGFGRTLAAIIAHHGDDNGLVLPPVVAPRQVVIVPIPYKGKEKLVEDYSKEVEKALRGAGIRVLLDGDNRLRPGEKYYKWEMFGVPIRADIGPKEAETNTVTLVRRDTKEKAKVGLNVLVEEVDRLFEEIQSSLSAKSWARLRNEITDAHDLDVLRNRIESRKIVRVNWCGDPHCAYEIKDQVAGEIRGTLWNENKEPTGECIVCRDPGKYIAYISRTY
ncbi:MAG: proline--tRNA ligase [Candidatus Bathyarchaeota archaeon]|jgi:prolyl-tRNA synthetase